MPPTKDIRCLTAESSQHAKLCIPDKFHPNEPCPTPSPQGGFAEATPMALAQHPNDLDTGSGMSSNLSFRLAIHRGIILQDLAKVPGFHPWKPGEKKNHYRPPSKPLTKEAYSLWPQCKRPPSLLSHCPPGQPPSNVALINSAGIPCTYGARHQYIHETLGTYAWLHVCIDSVVCTQEPFS